MVQAPDAKFFLDINADDTIPAIDQQDLKRYCSLASNENNTNAEKMYKESYLLTFRIAAEGTK